MCIRDRPYAVLLHIIDASGDRVPLMEAREHLRTDFTDTSREVFFLFHFLENEVVEDTKPTILAADVVPEIARGILRVAFLHRRVTGMTIFGSLVKGQKLRLLRTQIRAHPDLVLGDGKMNHSPAFIHEKIVLSIGSGFNGFALVLILHNGILNLCLLYTSRCV